MNRSPLLCRILNYLDRAGFAGSLLVYDSSNQKKELDLSAQLCEQFKNRFKQLKYKYLDPAEYTLAEIQSLAGRETETPYITHCADDDALTDV